MIVDLVFELYLLFGVQCGIAMDDVVFAGADSRVTKKPTISLQRLTISHHDLESAFHTFALRKQYDQCNRESQPAQPPSVLHFSPARGTIAATLQG